MDAAAEERLQHYISGIGEILGHPKRREAFASYALGLFSDLERKSVEPIAALTCPDPARVDAAHQSLLHFVSTSDWDDHTVRRFAAQYAMEAMSARAPITTWIVDDTGFLKQDKHSVGVKRQYTRTAGKIANCQIGVSLTVSNGQDHLPIDVELYLPEEWANDPARRREARIPKEVQFKTKIDLALDMLERAVANQVPGEIVLADAAYGRSAKFRDTVRLLGFDYAVGVDTTTKVVVLGPGGQRSTEQAYEEMKGELGLDHFEGRRFRGFYHHVSVVLCCYAFVVAERARSFFPSADREDHAHTLRLAA